MNSSLNGQLDRASLTPWFLSEFLLRSQLFSSYLYRINHAVRRQSETIFVLVDREALYVIIGMSLQTLKIQILDGWNTKSWLISKLIALCRSGLMALSRSSSFRSFCCCVKRNCAPRFEQNVFCQLVENL